MASVFFSLVAKASYTFIVSLTLFLLGLLRGRMRCHNVAEKQHASLIHSLHHPSWPARTSLHHLSFLLFCVLPVHLSVHLFQFDLSVQGTEIIWLFFLFQRCALCVPCLSLWLGSVVHLWLLFYYLFLYFTSIIHLLSHSLGFNHPSCSRCLSVHLTCSSFM